MKKLIFAEIPIEKFQAIGSGLERELGCIAYSGYVIYENRKYYLQGRSAVNTFCNRAEAMIAECQSCMNRAEDQAAYSNDRQLLATIKKTKAS